MARAHLAVGVRTEAEPGLPAPGVVLLSRNHFLLLFCTQLIGRTRVSQLLNLINVVPQTLYLKKDKPTNMAVFFPVIL